GQDAPGVVGRELEEAADRVAVAVPRQRHIPSSRSTPAMTCTACSRSSSECAADTEMRRRDLCLGTAGQVTGCRYTPRSWVLSATANTLASLLTSTGITWAVDLPTSMPASANRRRM